MAGMLSKMFKSGNNSIKSKRLGNGGYEFTLPIKDKEFIDFLFLITEDNKDIEMTTTSLKIKIDRKDKAGKFIDFATAAGILKV